MMKEFDELEIRDLLKTKKMSIDEFFKTKDRELSMEEKSLQIEEKSLAVEKVAANALEDISNLLATLSVKDTVNSSKITECLVCLGNILDEIRKQETEKRPTKWIATFNRNSAGLIDGEITFEAEE